MSEKRDIAAEIDMRCKAVEAIMQVRTTDKGYPTILDEVLEIVGYESLITRTAEAESKVATVEGERDRYKAGFDAAIERLASLPHTRMCRWIDDECEHHREYPDCVACLSDRLLPKEAATHA